jgi:hypothetical protein
MREAQAAGSLDAYFAPALSSTERAVAELEGWIFGKA